MSDDLVAFIRARLDDEEAVASAACAEYDRAVGFILDGAYDDGLLAPDTFVRRHDPARVLRQVEAARAVLNLDDPDTDGGYVDGFNGCRGLVVTMLGSIWSDHPDYRDEWKP